ncbi:phosphate propanoyltransferase, partial [Enterocloster citroniae]|nr:phosphate propanoyltransferase [Enterocloster citroniae]
MDQYEAIIRLLMKAAKEDALGSQANGQDSGQAGGQCPEKDDRIPVGISNRHVHLSREDLSDLFGAGYELTKMKDLSQPGQYACKETVTICGPKGAIEKVRILGPVRPRTQVEILSGDSFKLGIKAPARLSGDLDKTPGITIIGPRGSVQTKEGLMAAQRHIHMLPQDAARFGVH